MMGLNKHIQSALRLDLNDSLIFVKLSSSRVDFIVSGIPDMRLGVVSFLSWSTAPFDTGISGIVVFVG